MRQTKRVVVIAEPATTLTGAAPTLRPEATLAVRPQSTTAATKTGREGTTAAEHERALGCRRRRRRSGNEEETIGSTSREDQRAARKGWLLTLEVRSQPTQCAYIGAGEGRCASPSNPLLPAAPCRSSRWVVRLVADYLHRAAVVEHGDDATVLVRGNAVSRCGLCRGRWTERRRAPRQRSGAWGCACSS